MITGVNAHVTRAKGGERPVQRHVGPIQRQSPGPWLGNNAGCGDLQIANPIARRAGQIGVSGQRNTGIGGDAQSIVEGEMIAGIHRHGTGAQRHRAIQGDIASRQRHRARTQLGDAAIVSQINIAHAVTGAAIGRIGRQGKSGSGGIRANG